LISQNQYKCFRKDRDHSGGGIVGITVKSDIAVVPVTLPEKLQRAETGEDAVTTAVSDISHQL